jgi:hypothetical protein
LSKYWFMGAIGLLLSTGAGGQPTSADNRQVGSVFPDGVWQSTSQSFAEEGKCSRFGWIYVVEAGEQRRCGSATGKCSVEKNKTFERIDESRSLIKYHWDGIAFGSVETVLEDGGRRLRNVRGKLLTDEYRKEKGFKTNGEAEADFANQYGVGWVFYKCTNLTANQWLAGMQRSDELEAQRQRREAERQNQIAKVFLTPAQKTTLSLLVMSGSRHHFAGSSATSCAERIRDFEYGSSDYTRRALVNACKPAVYDVCNVGAASDALCRDGRIVLQDLSDALQCNKQMLYPC